MTLKVDDVLQQMKTRCRNELTLVPAIYEEQLVKLRHTEWNEETKQLVEHMHVQLFSSVEASTSLSRMFSVFSFVKFLSCMDNATSYQTAYCGVIDNVAILH